MNQKPEKSYILCATPRSGSTYLCSLLKSTGVAGIPESYFRRQDLQMWAEKWGIIKTGGTFDFSDFVKAAQKNGSTENGTFAMRVMWGTLEEIVLGLCEIYPCKDLSDKNILNHAFGETNYIYLKRQDFIAQAVSLVRALQTDIWHAEGADNHAQERQPPQYDFDKIHQFFLEAEEHNNCWESWFRQNDIQPHRIIYEELCAQPKKTVIGALSFLGLKLPDNIEIKSRNKRLSDDINIDWIERYKQDIKQDTRGTV